MANTDAHSMAKIEINDQTTMALNSEQPGDAKEAVVHDLQNAIHPVFAPSNFEISELVCDLSKPVDGNSILPYTREIEYEAMAPMLRLASHLLSTECLLDYWYAVLCNETKPMADGVDGEEQLYTVVELEESNDPGGNGCDPLQKKSSDDEDYRGPDRISKRETESLELEACEEMLEDLGLENIKACEACEQDIECAEESPCSREEEDQEIEEFDVFRKGEPLNDADIAEVRSCLEVLAQNVSFVRGDVPRHTPAATQVYNEPIKTDDSQIGAGFEGRRSYIIINANLYQQIVDLYNEAKQTCYGELPRKYLFLSFHLAVSIVHELAHVAHFAQFGHTSVPFEDNALSENGFDWENVIFGGLPYEASQLIQWPCKMIMPLKDDTAGLSQRGEVQDDVMTYWDIPEEFILQLFRNEFWEVVVAKRGAEALKMPKGVEKTVTSTADEE